MLAEGSATSPTHAVALTAKHQNLMTAQQPFAPPALSCFLLTCACKLLVEHKISYRD